MLQKSSMSRTLKVFFDSPTKEHYLSDISKTLGLAHTSVKKNLTELAKQGIILESVQKRGSRKFPLYKASTASNLFKKYKAAANISSIIESGLAEFIDEKLAPNSVVLFGSYFRGEDTEDSDIDLFVECDEEKIDLKKFEKLLGRKIELHFNKKFSSYPNELKNNIANGIVLSGFLEAYS